MKSLAIAILLATAALFAQQPPLYLGTSTSTAPLGTLTPPFTATSKYNTTIASVPSGNLLTLLTDANWKCASMTATTLSEAGLSPSGGDNDIASSVNGTYIVVHLNGTNCLLHLATNTDGAFENVTNGGENGYIKVPGPFGFSKVTDNQFYWLSNNHLLHQGTITSDTTYVETVNTLFPFDYDTCPGTGVAPGTNAVSASILGISFNDGTFSINLSWTGGQGTAHIVMAYTPGVGCTTLDTATGNWYAYGAKTPSGTESSCLTPGFATGQAIHDSQISNDGGTMAISGGAFNMGKDNFCFWQVGTGNAVGLSSIGNGLAGHESMAGRFLIDSAIPNPNMRLVSPLAPESVTNYTILNQLPNTASGPGGYHGAQPHPFGSDLTPWIVESAGAIDGTSYLTPEYLQNEIFGLPTYGTNQPILRFGSTYNSGQSGTFACGNGIGYPLQNGTGWVFLTDSLLNLGLDSNGKPMCYLAILKLVKP
jgi:hypothetical protein